MPLDQHSTFDDDLASDPIPNAFRFTNLRDMRPVDPVEVEQLDRAIALLDHPGKWCKGEDHTIAGRRCIRGALNEINAYMPLREAIVTAANEITGRRYPTVEMFNDAPLTTHRLLMRVLHRARANLGAVTPAPTPKVNLWQRALGLLPCAALDLI